MKNINCTVQIDEFDLLDVISDNLSNEEIIKFIMRLERNYKDWDITKKLYKYFKEQKDVFEKEFPEDEKW